MSVDGCGQDEIPLLNNTESDVLFSFRDGECLIDTLAVAPNSSGTDGHEYKLMFELKLSGKGSYDIAPYALSFLFTNGKYKSM